MGFVLDHVDERNTHNYRLADLYKIFVAEVTDDGAGFGVVAEFKGLLII